MSMFYRANRLEEHALAAVLNLCALLRIRVPRGVASRLLAHPYYPSMASMIDVLEDQGIEALAVTLPANQLNAIPLPAIAHLTTGGGQFVVLERINADGVTYIDGVAGRVTVSPEFFQSCWSGHLLLVAVRDESAGDGSVYPVERRRSLWLSRVAVYVLPLFAVLLCMFSVGGLTSVSMFYHVLYVVSLLGGTFVCVLLTGLSHGAQRGMFSALCDHAAGGGCRRVLSSAMANVGGVSLAEAGLVYFGGSLVGMLLGDVAGVTYVLSGYYGVIASVAVWGAVFSVFYQKYVVGGWCKLCLTVAALLVVQVCLLTLIELPLVIDVKSLLLLVVGYLFVLGGWMSMRGLYIRALRVDSLEHAAHALKQNPVVIDALLRIQSEVQPVDFDHDVVLGNPEAVFTITLVIHPDCGPCKTAYGDLQGLLVRFRSRVRVVIRFAGHALRVDDRAAQVSRYFIRLSLLDTRAAEAALTHWFTTGTLPESLGSVPHDAAAMLARDVYSQHQQWLARVGITTTPYCILNSRVLPPQLALGDLAVYLKETLPMSPVHRFSARPAQTSGRVTVRRGARVRRGKL